MLRIFSIGLKTVQPGRRKHTHTHAQGGDDPNIIFSDVYINRFIYLRFLLILVVCDALYCCRKNRREVVVFIPTYMCILVGEVAIGSNAVSSLGRGVHRLHWAFW